MRSAAQPLTGVAGDYDSLVDLIGDVHFVLLGEASHGTQEFYRERAIGVIYRPETERLSHYFFARVPEQFDAIVHSDETQAVKPLEHWTPPKSAEVPETYPSGQ